MSPLYATRRRAEEFEAVVDAGLARSPGSGSSDPRYDDLLALVGALRAVPQPAARPDFVTELRARLVAEAATLPKRAPSEVDRLRLRTVDPGRVRNPRERRLSLALGAVALVGATTALAIVAQGALPGDTLYPLKRGIESAHASLSLGDDGKGSTLLASADTRLGELAQLAQRHSDDPQNEAEIADTLDDFTQQATDASDHLLAAYQQSSDPAEVTKLRSFATSSMRSLAALDGQLPDSATDEWVHAVTTVVRIDDQAKQTCLDCAGAGLDGIVPELPTVGTGFGTDALPAVNLPDVALPTLTLPSIAGSPLPPGSVTKPTPSQGPGAGPSGLPTSLPTVLPTGVPTGGVPTSALPTGGLPTPGATPSPTVDVTQLLDALTGGPTPQLPLPSVDVSQLLGGVGSALPTALPSALPSVLGGLLGP